MTHKELARIYLKVGANAFGGWSTTHLLLEQELLTKRRLLSREQLETAIVSGQALPGPAQLIIAAQTAYYTKGIKGAIIGSLAYLAPSLILTIIFSFLYFRYLVHTDLASHTLGLQAAVGGIIIGNAYRIAKRHTTSLPLWLVVISAGIASFLFHFPTMLIILGSGIIGVAYSFSKKDLLNG